MVNDYLLESISLLQSLYKTVCRLDCPYGEYRTPTCKPPATKGKVELQGLYLAPCRGEHVRQKNVPVWNRVASFIVLQPAYTLL